jgi:hypothetical protein
LRRLAFWGSTIPGAFGGPQFHHEVRANPAQNGDLIRIEITDRPGRPFEFLLAPWPFSVEALAVEAEARSLPPGERFSSEAAMRSWLASPARETFKAMLFAA